jgi:hypothetical protein
MWPAYTFSLDFALLPKRLLTINVQDLFVRGLQVEGIVKNRLSYTKLLVKKIII